jgi:hypothetical protein
VLAPTPKDNGIGVKKHHVSDVFPGVAV